MSATAAIAVLGDRGADLDADQPAFTYVFDPQKHSYSPAAASFNTLMSSLCIFSIACITRSAFARSVLESSSPRTGGTICQETPNLSFTQPHRSFSPPSESL